MKAIEIFEARKNPEQNPKTAINKIIGDAVKQAKPLSGTEVANLFVSFTAIDKLGINPKSKYETPIGIYAYPGEYVEKKVGSESPMRHLPFAGDQPFVNVFKAQGNIIDLNAISAEEVVDLYRKIAEAWAKLSKQDWKTAVDQVETYVNEAGSRANFPKRPGGRLWYVTMKVARDLLQVELKTSPPIAWNKLFRMIGVDGAVDTGTGIIHTSEPAQAVFFSKDAVTDVNRYNNKYSPQNVSNREASGKFQQQRAEQLGPELNDPKKSPEEVKAFIDEWHSPQMIALIKNPEMRARVLELMPEAARFIKHPTMYDLGAISRANSYELPSILPRASTKVLVQAIQHLGDNEVRDIVNDLIYDTKRPLDPTVQLAIIRRDPRYAKDIKNIAPSVAKIALANWPKGTELPFDLQIKAGVKLDPTKNPEYIKLGNWIKENKAAIGELQIKATNIHIKMEEHMHMQSSYNPNYNSDTDPVVNDFLADLKDIKEFMQYNLEEIKDWQQKMKEIAGA